MAAVERTIEYLIERPPGHTPVGARGWWEWANWVAQDENGDLYAYAHLPMPSTIVGQRIFVNKGKDGTTNDGHYQRIGYVHPPLDDWRNSIVPIRKQDEASV